MTVPYSVSARRRASPNAGEATTLAAATCIPWKITALHLVLVLGATDGGHFLCPHRMPSATFVPSLALVRWRDRADDALAGSRAANFPRGSPRLSMSAEGSGRDVNATSSSDGSGSAADDAEDGNGILDDLSWRVAKARLEDANTRRFLKSRPYKLPYATSQRWIQRNWAPATREEFEELVENGNLRTPYISKRPEQYYGARGEWISWEHYLLGECAEGDAKNGTQVGKWQ